MKNCYHVLENMPICLPYRQSGMNVRIKTMLPESFKPRRFDNFFVVVTTSSLYPFSRTLMNGLSEAKLVSPSVGLSSLSILIAKSTEWSSLSNSVFKFCYPRVLSIWLLVSLLTVQVCESSSLLGKEKERRFAKFRTYVTIYNYNTFISRRG